MGCLFSCCERGGCCRQAPPMLIKGPTGEVVRINLLFDLGCCSSGAGVVDEYPPELYAHGLSEATFRTWIDKLPGINRNRPTKCKSACDCIVTTIFCPCFVGAWCRGQARAVQSWDRALRDWQSQFNELELERIGYYVKTQSRCDVSYDKNGKHRHIERWIAIALSPEESTKLKQEPHMTGEVESGCCGGPNETDCCMHP